MHHPTDRIAHTTAFVTPVVEHWLERDRNGRKKGNVLFNDALNTFYLRLYGVGHMVKYHSESERGNPLTPQHSISNKGSVLSHRQDSTYPGLCYTSRGALGGTRIQ